MTDSDSENQFTFHKLVLTGGPCGGKTTGQARLSTFFESLGWKVYRAPETALIFLSGGVHFSELETAEAYTFQENIFKTILQIEKTYDDLARTRKQNILLICDRGCMDATAYIPQREWERIKAENEWNELELRDDRYCQVIHMVSAANGAEAFYTTSDHKTRSESLEIARELDNTTANAWVGHPCFDVIDNSTDFEGKIARMISAVCTRAGISCGDRLAPDSIKRKFLIASVPDEKDFPHYQEFNIVNDFLVTPCYKLQARIRKRGQQNRWTYTHTYRRPEIHQQIVEVRLVISEKDYEILKAQRDDRHLTVYKLRRCFLWKNHYYQLDFIKEPCNERCKGLIFLETFASKDRELTLPGFLKIEQEVTRDPFYTTFSLSLKDEQNLSRDPSSYSKCVETTAENKEMMK